jgi:HupE / UreJ protein
LPAFNKFMSAFQLYFMLGKEHILDYANGYDHILFVLALCAMYLMRDWKKILILITAFTVGHSITLALSTLSIVSVDAELIEFLIPLTIFITAVSNIFRKEEHQSTLSLQLNYGYALFFGLIHGLGFSNYLKSVLGKDHSIIKQLLAFNIGLEFGQIIIVAIFLIAAFIIVDLMGRSRRDWKIILSSAIAGIALVLMKDKIFW